ncbi:T9SS type A sorting domain-containing protein [Fulvivirga sp. 29W222]|uniref:T9SS type A sorting domain-containing protein n=1 Tax=Fulvivirga marina TaxID=2494733 RepID=A0A937KBE4_9BACT|nr:T9SS type A sorting domain-containing protein [Fulvivirga marina]MBL6446791.1 T9SS type A sorting domain-containing protein [Fulvivirga marina]
MLKVLKYVIAVLITFSIGQSMAQLKVYSIKKTDQSAKKKKDVNAREEATVINLPFWDDFSYSNNQPSDSLWQASGVFINNGLGITPPSLGVASFDGTDAYGQGYSVNANSSGKTDSLTSLPIDLSGLSVSDDVYISFFYQYAGYGDSPDSEDSIRLEIMKDDSTWVSIWPGSVQLNTTGNFIQVIKKIDDAAYFHESFQFQFTSFGRRSGPFDVWNIDYVYVNKNRSESDLFFPDRTISTPMIKIFNDYVAIPYNHFDPSLLEYPTLNFYNLEDGTIPSPYGYKVGGVINYYHSGVLSSDLFDTLSITAVGQPLAPREIQSLKLDPFLSSVTFNNSADSVEIEATLAIDAGDNVDDYDPAIYSPMDFRINDTTRSTFTLSSYYAYDDSGAEVAAGLLNGAGKSLAYQFDLAKDTTDYIVAIDIYFPYINTDPTGKEIDLSIWRAIDTNNSSPSTTSIIHRERTVAQRGSGLNEFVRYKLRNAVEVTDTFFIGYKQIGAGDLGIGLDKNTNSGNKIFFNIDGTWQRNTLVEGSLMMRPIFGTPPSSTVTGLPGKVTTKLSVYPNPSSGKYTIKGTFKTVKVFDIHGVEQNFSLISDGKNATLNLEHHAEGLYILQFIRKERIETIKVFKKE